MDYIQVKSWVREHHPSILLICSYEHDDSYQTKVMAGCVTIDFSLLQSEVGTYGTFLHNTDTNERVVLIKGSGIQEEDIMTLLHEVGHAVSHQKKSRGFNCDSIYYNEIQAWKYCKATCDGLGLKFNLEYALKCFNTYVEYYGVTKYCSSLMVDIGFMSKEFYDGIYSKVTNHKPVWGFESWRSKRK